MSKTREEAKEFETTATSENLFVSLMILREAVELLEEMYVDDGVYNKMPVDMQNKLDNFFEHYKYGNLDENDSDE